VLGGKSAIGQLVRESRTESNGEQGPWREIVGNSVLVVVTADGDIHYRGNMSS